MYVYTRSRTLSLSHRTGDTGEEEVWALLILLLLIIITNIIENGHFFLMSSRLILALGR